MGRDAIVRERCLLRLGTCLPHPPQAMQRSVPLTNPFPQNVFGEKDALVQFLSLSDLLPPSQPHPPNLLNDFRSPQNLIRRDCLEHDKDHRGVFEEVEGPVC